jgi:hypothetical protein
MRFRSAKLVMRKIPETLNQDEPSVREWLSHLARTRVFVLFAGVTVPTSGIVFDTISIASFRVDAAPNVGASRLRDCKLVRISSIREVKTPRRMLEIVVQY